MIQEFIVSLIRSFIFVVAKNLNFSSSLKYYRNFQSFLIKLLNTLILKVEITHKQTIYIFYVDDATKRTLRTTTTITTTKITA